MYRFASDFYLFNSIEQPTFSAAGDTQDALKSCKLFIIPLVSSSEKKTADFGLVGIMISAVDRRRRGLVRIPFPANVCKQALVVHGRNNDNATEIESEGQLNPEVD